MVAFESTALGEWRADLEAYSSRLEALDNKKLTELDRFYREEVPELVAGRNIPHLKKEEVVKIVDWKLTRGKWRPRLLGFAQALKDSEVEETTAQAFASLPNLHAAISLLTALKGIGPATASALLAVRMPSIAPFMSDEALSAAVGGVKEYTVKRYMEFAVKLQEKAQELTAAVQVEAKEGVPFTASDVERALWSTAAESMKPRGGAKQRKTASSTTIPPEHMKKRAKR